MYLIGVSNGYVYLHHFMNQAMFAGLVGIAYGIDGRFQEQFWPGFRQTVGVGIYLFKILCA
jgi:hypothetical protein